MFNTRGFDWFVAKRPARNIATLAICVAMTGALAGCAATHGGPVVDRGDQPPEATGTISGIVRAAGSNAPIGARRVTAVDVTTGAKYEATTATNGGYTMKVPVGRYRMEVELRPDEAMSASPGEVDINRSDLDSGRDFVITVKR